VALCAALLAWAGPVCAAADTGYLAELVARSRQLQLSQRPEWLKLLHYEPNRISSGVHGLVVSPQFYNAPDGRTDPQAELEATLASFYSDLAENDKQQNPQCLFIARFAWLDEQLSFDPRRLPRQTCPRYRNWHAALDPGGVTLIFASAYLNNPSSMFGHTLLRIDAKDQDETTRLLAYSINFAANTDETSGLAFAVNGLFGGYAGTFSILPYYAKVREYSDLENRDLWEYQLDLSAAEVDRVLMHAWELGSVQFRYYFFDQNCSYQLLSLLQVARPQMDLTGSFRGVWAAPSDTVRAVTAQPNLLKAVIYRPAGATVIRRRLAALGELDRRLVMDLSSRRIAAGDAVVSGLPDQRAAAVIESAEDYVAYRRSIGKTDVADAAGLEHELVVARGLLDVGTQAPEVPVPPVRPDQGHDISRVSLGVGRWDGRNFEELSARGAYTGIMDDDRGYVPGAQIEFLNLGVRHYGDGAPRVEYVTPLSILSLTPRDDFFRPLSWNIETGWLRVRMADASEPLVFHLDGGAGGTWSIEDGAARVYALLDADSRIGRSFSSAYQFGAGPRIGVLFDPDPLWRLQAYASGFRYFLGQLETKWTFGLEQRLALGHNLALRADISREEDFKRIDNNGAVSMLYYF
jgi:uncharacterized protein DUF4105